MLGLYKQQRIHSCQSWATFCCRDELPLCHLGMPRRMGLKVGPLSSLSFCFRFKGISRRIFVVNVQSKVLDNCCSLQDRGRMTVADLQRVTGIDVLEADIVNQLRSNVKVDFNAQTGTYAYKVRDSSQPQLARSRSSFSRPVSV